MGIVGVQEVAYGRPATETLASAIAEAKDGDALAPVTVIVPSHLAGLSARRLLGSGLLDSSARGIANVAFATPLDLAQLLGVAHTGGRTPLTNPVLAAAVRHVLRTRPGWFADVAAHHATELALVGVYGELAHARLETLEAIEAGSRRGREVVRLFRAVRSRLSGSYDEADLAAAALARVDSDPAAVGALGPVVWYLPAPAAPGLAGLVRAVVQQAPSRVVVGLTGDHRADDAVLRATAVLRPSSVATRQKAAGERIQPATGTRIVSVSDADEECRAVAREVLKLAEEGVPFDRIGVFFPLADPYARTLDEHLTAAGIPHNGPSRTRLADTVAGRTLLAALALPGGGWGRAAVIALLSGAPLRHEGRPIKVTFWDRISRDAGVVGGLDDWRAKLTAAAEGGPSGRPRPQPEARTLLAFVERLRADLDAVTTAPTWAQRSERARQLLERLLGPESRRTRWTEDHAEAAERVDAALARLGVLDDLEPDPTPTAFERAVGAELEAPAGRTGVFGHGVLFGPLASAVGADLDAVFVVGMAEGTCPAPRHDDSLLPDEDRRRSVEGELADRDARLDDQHRAYLAALAAGGRHRVLLFPRGDLRGGRTRLPSRWLLDTASARAGTRVHSSDFPVLGPTVVDTVASFVRGVAEAPTPANAGERDLAAVLAHVEAGGDALGHPVVAGDLARGLQCRRARASDAFTEWDGNLAGQPVPSPATGEVFSASRIETWAGCPFRYYLAHVLRLDERDDPELVTEIAAVDKGSLVHDILERFITDAVERSQGPPQPHERWTPEDREHLHHIAAEVFRTYEDKGVTGRPLHWRRTQAEVLDDLDAFLVRDSDRRAETATVPQHAELAFGLDGSEPVPVHLSDGRSLQFRGRIDRIDRRADGTGHVVYDYKTGKGDKYAGLDDDPVLAGTTLQLGIYAEAARARLGAERVTSAYWMATQRGEFAVLGYEWTDENRQRFTTVIDAMVEGIEGGVFPALSGEYDSFWRSHANCGFCDFNRLCPRDRDDHQQAKAAAPELAVLDRLLPPQPEPQPEPEAGTATPPTAPPT